MLFIMVKYLVYKVLGLFNEIEKSVNLKDSGSNFVWFSKSWPHESIKVLSRNLVVDTLRLIALNQDVSISFTASKYRLVVSRKMPYAHNWV